MNTMNVFALEGHRIIVTEYTKDNGYDEDQQLINKYLVIDQIYTVEHTEVGSWRTDVFLVEVPDVAFDSVNFEDVTYQPEDEDRLHSDWNYHNGGIL